MSRPLRCTGCEVSGTGHDHCLSCAADGLPKLLSRRLRAPLIVRVVGLLIWQSIDYASLPSLSLSLSLSL